MTPEQIEALKRAAEAATPGPWKTNIVESTRVTTKDHTGIAQICGDYGTKRVTQKMEENATFIALANPATILALIADREAQIERADHAESFCYRAAKAAGAHEFVCAETVSMRARIAELEATLERVFTSGNHLGLLRTEKWPDYSVSWEEALFLFGAGPEYETWCAWSGIMRARAALREGEPTMISEQDAKDVTDFWNAVIRNLSKPDVVAGVFLLQLRNGEMHRSHVMIDGCDPYRLLGHLAVVSTGTANYAISRELTNSARESVSLAAKEETERRAEASIPEPDFSCLIQSKGEPT